MDFSRHSVASPCFLGTKIPGLAQVGLLSGLRSISGCYVTCWGVVMSADGFFQAFGGKPLFPWYEDSWIGTGWFIVWTKVNFWEIRYLWGRGNVSRWIFPGIRWQAPVSLVRRFLDWHRLVYCLD